MNKVILTAIIGKDVDLKYVANKGTVVAKTTLAVKREFKKDETDWINAIAFGKTAETMAQYLTKGSKIGVVGRIQTGSYQAQDGTKKYTTDVVIESFEFLSSKKKTDNQIGNQPTDNSEMGFGYMTPVDCGEVPF